MAAGVATVALGASAVARNNRQLASQFQQKERVMQQIDQFLLNAADADDDNEQPNGNAPTPQNDLPISVSGANFRDDGCGDTSVRLAADGLCLVCYPLLRGGPCPDPYLWVTVNPIDLTVHEYIYSTIFI